MGMLCSACGEVNRDDARFCAGCGVRIAARCTTCDRELASGARFCDGCGAPVVGAGSSAGDVAQQARKTVTIVFADLEGSTGLQERMDPESVRALMDRYYAAMREAVGAHAGKVVKFVGDGVMAVFGVPEVAEDDAVRALRAAADMQIAFEPLASAVLADHGTELALRIGVNTGEVVVDADDADVVGDAVNVAARLETAAGPSQVLVGDETWRLTRHAARFEPMPPLALKGRAETVSAFQLTELVESADAGAAPFVGRAEELATLTSLFETVAREASPRLATVVGSPGVGKSRLVGELGAGLGDRATTIIGRCDQAGGATFAPVADLLRGLGPLEELIGDDSERERLLAAVEGLTGASAGAALQATPEETFWAVRRLLEIAAGTRPLVAVLDDVQWAEPLLLDLVEHLAEWITEPVLLLAVARPELRELRPSLTEAHGRAGAVLSLEGLTRAGTEQLARELLDSDDVPAPLLERLTISSDGNPLFVRELVRMLIDDGVILRDGAEWTLAVDATDIEVPPTIQSLLAARLDRLRSAERTVLERAAVIGAEVYRGALDELVPPELRPDLDAVLESLRRKELLEPAGTYWIDERVLRFHHALIRDAAYRRLLKDSRAGLHERAAAWLVAKTGGGADHDETIGFHLEQTQATRRSLGPLDDHGRVVAADAAARLGRAARRALDRDDLLAAAALADRALACLDPGETARAELLLTRCEALLGAGDVAAAGPAVDELAGYGAGDARLDAWATCFAVQRMSLADPRALGNAEPRLIGAAAVLAGAGDAAGAAKAHRVHASVLARLGRVGDCEAALDRALGAAREAGDRRQTTGVLSAAPLAALWGPSPVPRAGGRCLDVIRLVRITTGAPAVEATSIRCQAVLEAFRGRIDAARSLIATARAIAEDLGLRHGLLEVELFAGIVELCGDDAAAAAEHLARAQDGFTAMGVTTDAAQAAALRARAALALRRPDEALVHAATSEQLGGQDLKTFIAWRAVKAEVLAARGDTAEALELAQAAVAVAAGTDALIDHADALAALAGVQRAAGDDAAARRTAGEARSLYEQKGATALAARVAAPTSAEPSPATSAPVSSTPDMPTNEAWRIVDAFWDLVLEQRLDEAEDFLAPNLVQEDRRPLLSNRLDRAAWIKNLRAISALGWMSIDRHPVAVRGDDLVVTLTTYRGNFEQTLVSVLRAANGAIDLALTYDGADLASALAELNELYAAQLPAADARHLRDVCASLVAHNQRDWVAFRAALAEDVRVIDHRPQAGPGELVGADRFTKYARTMVEVAPDYMVVTRRILAITNHCTLGENMSVLTGSAGGHYEEPRFLLTRTDAEGKLDRRESFGPEQLDLAWARYRDLSAAAEQDRGNAASRAYARVADAIVAGRHDEALRIMSPTAVRDDRRPGLASRQEGVEANLENFRAIGRLGISGVDATVVAMRGERLALVRTLWHAAFEVSLLGVVRLDDAGRIDLVVDFDLSGLADALAELDELYVDKLPPADAATLSNATSRSYVEVCGLVTLGRVDEIALRVSPDIVFDDRRPGIGTRLQGRDAAMEMFRVLDRLGIERVDTEVVDVRGDHLAVMTSVWRGAFEVPLTVLLRADADGLIEFGVIWDGTELAAALEELEELTAEASGPGWGNQASRVGEIVRSAIVEGRIQELTSVVSPTMVAEDRRAGMSSRVEGFEQFRALADLGITSIANELKAIRGDRLALWESVWRGDFEVRLLTLVRLDESGRLDLTVLYEIDDLIVAFQDLDELYAAAEGAPFAGLLRQAVAINKAYGAHRWDDLRALYADDAVALDHRFTGYGEIHGADQLMARHHAMVELAPDYHIVAPRNLAISELCLLTESVAVATAAGGATYDVPRLIIVKLRTPVGPVERFEYFDYEQVDLAWERYRALTTVDPNARYRRAIDLALAGRYDELAVRTSPDYVLIDNRAGLATRLEGRSVMIDQMRAVVALGVRTMHIDVLATRGERLALIRGHYRGTDFEVEMLVVVGYDEQGRDEVAVMFDPDAIDAATTELDARFSDRALSAGPADNAALTTSRRWFDALLREDWDTVTRLQRPDLGFEDRRPLFATRVEGRDEAFEGFRAMTAIGLSEVSVEPIALRGDQLVLARLRLMLGDYEVVCLMLGDYDEAGLTRSTTIFDTDQLDDALVDLDERFLAGEGAAHAPWLGTTLPKVRYFHALRDWEKLRTIYDDDVVLVDHRPAGSGEYHGIDAVIDYHRAMVELAPTHRQVVRRHLAIGDRIVLIELVSGSDEQAGDVGNYEMVSLLVSTHDASGRTTRMERFAIDDLDGAWARYHELAV